jgi:hypothetical protein
VGIGELRKSIFAKEEAFLIMEIKWEALVHIKLSIRQSNLI